MKFLSSNTLFAKLIAKASTTSEASLNIPHGVEPTTLSNGDMWTTTGGLYARINGTTQTMAHTSSWSAMSVAEGTTGTATTSRFMRADYLKQIIQSLAVSTNSPAFTGTPTAPTASNGTNTTQLATTQFVLNQLAFNMDGGKPNSTYTGTDMTILGGNVNGL